MAIFFILCNYNYKKSPAPWKRDFVLSFQFNFFLPYACKLPLHFIAKVKEIKVKEEVRCKCSHILVILLLFLLQK